MACHLSIQRLEIFPGQFVEADLLVRLDKVVQRCLCAVQVLRRFIGQIFSLCRDGRNQVDSHRHEDQKKHAEHHGDRAAA